MEQWAMVQRDKQRRQYIALLVMIAMYPLALLGYVVFIVTQFSVSDFLHKSVFQVNLVIFILLIVMTFNTVILGTRLALAALRYLRQQDERRRNAQGMRLDAPHLQPHFENLPLTLRLRPRRWIAIAACVSTGLILVGVIGPLVVFGLNAYGMENGATVTIRPALLLPAIFGFFSAFYFGGLTIFLRQTVTFTDHGMTVRRPGYNGTMRWDDIRLFAEVRIHPLQVSSYRLQLFEVAHAKATLRWMHHTRPDLVMRPAGMSWEDYQRQMQIAAQYIRAKTGLPLVDVR